MGDEDIKHNTKTPSVETYGLLKLRNHALDMHRQADYLKEELKMVTLQAKLNSPEAKAKILG